MLHLTESDLRFVVETVATRRRDSDHIVHLLRDKEDLLEPMLEDPKLMERLFRDEEAFLQISPHLLFSVLLRRVRIELEKEAYVFEAAPRGKRVPIFEAPAVAQLLSNKQIRDYLADMLSSFARINSGVLYWKERGAWHKRRFSDVDMQDMIELARLADPEMRPWLHKRIADIALFLSMYRRNRRPVLASRSLMLVVLVFKPIISSTEHSRPERPELIRDFKHQIPHYNARHTVKPGITGLAQINGLRGDTDLTERIMHDLYYVEHWNLLFDLQMIFLTFFNNRNAC